EDVDDLVGFLGDEALLERELHAVGGKLHQPERPDAVRSGSALDAAQRHALEPHGVRGGREHDKQQQSHGHDHNDPMDVRVVVEVVHGWAGPTSTGGGAGSRAGVWRAISRWMGTTPA